MAEYIEREALLNDLRDSYHEPQKIYNGLRYDEERAICGGQLSTFLECVLRLRDAPAADVVERKRGRWIVDDCDSDEPNGYCAFIEFHCPFCNEPYTLESGEYNWYYGDDIPLKFCHECGADMRAVSANEA